MKRRLVFYVSGHGFGHSTRIQAVINHLPPDRAEVMVRTSAPEWLYRQNVNRPFELEAIECDVGVVQRDSLSTEIPETLARWLEFEEEIPAWAGREAEFLTEWRADLIVADIPSAAFEASAQAGIRSAAMTNFSWDWIYRNYAERVPEFAVVADRIGESYAKCDLLFRLPFFGDLSAFSRIEDVPLVVPGGKAGRDEVRQKLGVSPDETLICVSFGGFDFQRFPWKEAESRDPAVRFVVMGSEEDAPARNAICVPTGTMPHCDLVRAADLVVSKPGYGTVAECIATQTPLLYTSRGEFAEYQVLVEGMTRFIPCRFVSPEDIANGKVIDEALRFLAELSWNDIKTPRTDGAEVVAKRLLSFV